MKTKVLTKFLFCIIAILLTLSSITVYATTKDSIDNSVLSSNTSPFTISDHYTDKLSNTSINPIGAYLSFENTIYAREYYIRNARSGQYLDVSGGVAAEGTNVQQYKFNGSDAQKWAIIYDSSDSSIFIASRVGYTNNTYYYVLDVNNGDGYNDVNVQLWSYNGSDAQKFRLNEVTYNEDPAAIFAFSTKCSGYSKYVVISGASHAQGANVIQYDFNGTLNDVWILEPVERNRNLALYYSQVNYNKYIPSFPDLTNYEGYTADCANFVSQCLLVSGIHMRDNWYIYSRNIDNLKPTNSTELDNGWELADPSPWISAKEFRKYWQKSISVYIAKGSDILNNYDSLLSKNYRLGDVVQYTAVPFINASLTRAEHTMFIQGKGNINGEETYVYAAHSNPRNDQDLRTALRSYADRYFIYVLNFLFRKKKYILEEGNR